MRRLLLIATLFSGLAQAAEPLIIDVHRDPNCGCCTAWIKHLEQNGFSVRDHVEADMPALKTRLGVPHSLGSCHTGVINGKFVEGHVPAAEVVALSERDDLLGAAVPGMPMGSPGMEMGGRQQAFSVIGVDRSGAQPVLADYPAR